MTKILEIDKLSASYGGGLVIDGISLVLREGEIFGIVGPNGHGKTSLLRAISGLMPHRTGSVHFEGREIAGQAPERIAARGIVHVPQGDLVYKNMTVLENLLVGGYTNASIKISDQQLEKVYTLFPKLKERESQSASSLSGGERRMLGIGRGLMMANAKLLLLDEPSLGLAPIVIEQIYTAIGNLRESGLTIVIVEENIGRVAAIADRMCLLDRGHMLWSGVPAELTGNRQLIETYLGT
ncbi:ABC transporter ATP-binding protein [Agrobacterium genomosp. 3 str. RTP8]|uniref:ABC transporter ATP-binding protein n=1 Tax=Agrobacterium tomkonis TaxID=1183410 RepID=UPI001CD9D53F|nr:ABC transporter ATP-binding protein [Agrobacterium tomkonis RTP8]